MHTQTFYIQVPTDAVAAATYARFRLTDATGGNTGPTGTGGNGEVEDIPVTIYDQGQLATITGQTFENTNGTGVIAAGNTGQDGWSVSLVNLDTGQTVATQTSGPQDTTLNGQPVVEHGIYEFLNVVPGHYQVVATPPTIAGLSTPIVTAPASSEGATSYDLNVQADQHYGAVPSGMTVPTSAGLSNVSSGTDSVFTLAQFMMIQGSDGHAGSGSTGGSGGSGNTSAGSTNQPIRISVVGNMSVFHDVVNSSGLLPSQINGMTLTGLAVSQSEEGGPVTVLGPVTVTLGMFPSTGTIGPSSSGETTGDTANYSLYLSIDLSSFGYGVMVNTRPLTVSGTVTQIPFYDTILKRSGGGSPIPLRDQSTGSEPLRLVSASFTTMYGLDQGSFYPGTISGTVYEDATDSNQFNPNMPGLAGATVMVTQVSTEGPSTDEGGGEGSGNGGNGGNGNGGSGGESTPPPVYITQTDAQGNWSITDLGPGTYTVTEIPPHRYGLSEGNTFSYSVTMTSRGQFTGNNFLNYPINQPPVIAAPGGITGMEDSNLTFSAGAGNGISVSDEDAGTNPVQVTLSTADGTLNLPETTSLTFLQDSATGSSQIVANGTIDAINAALAGLTLSPTAHFNGPGSLTVSVNDLGNSGNGGPQTATTIIPLNISAVADAPALNVGNAHGSASNQIPLGISVSRAAGANTEILMVTVSGVPSGAVLTAGTDLGNGQWQLTPQQLTGLAIVSPNPGTYPLTVTATATEPSNGSTATTVLPLSVTVDNVVPQIYSAGDQTATVNDPTAINLGSFWDTPTDGAWNVMVNWGDTTSSAFSDGATGQIGIVPHTYTHSGRFTVTVAVQDKNGGASSSQFLVTVGPTEVAQVQIGNGTAQRSMIRSLTVTFSGPVNILPGAFTLQDQRGRTVKLNVATALVNGQTVATLTFKGQRIVGGSL
ncbi:MAG: GEVED domain-containing protein [Isosphaeraceae bacterium]